MNFVYHRVPSQLEGNTLYPLNRLKDLYPKLYEQQAAKYAGREEIPGWHIEPLDCLWNDVLFLSPVEPHSIRQAMIEACYDFPPMRFFKIPACMLDPAQTVIRHYRRRRIDPPRYDAYDPCTIDRYAPLSPETVENYRSVLARGERPFVFLHVPHILYKGTLGVAGLAILEV